MLKVPIMGATITVAPPQCDNGRSTANQRQRRVFERREFAALPCLASTARQTRSEAQGPAQ